MTPQELFDRHWRTVGCCSEDILIAEIDGYLLILDPDGPDFYSAPACPEMFNRRNLIYDAEKRTFDQLKLSESLRVWAPPPEVRETMIQLIQLYL